MVTSVSRYYFCPAWRDHCCQERSSYQRHFGRVPLPCNRSQPCFISAAGAGPAFWPFFGSRLFAGTPGLGKAPGACHLLAANPGLGEALNVASQLYAHSSHHYGKVSVSNHASKTAEEVLETSRIHAPSLVPDSASALDANGVGFNL